MYIHKVLTLLLLSGAAFCSAEVLIVNGMNSDITRYPFMASLRIRDSHSCGCSILSPTWVLTATHCVKAQDVDEFSVQYGVTNISESGPNIVQVKRIVMHPNYYDENYLTNDIAVLELSQKIYFNHKTVAPVKLPPQDFEVPKDARGTLIGWGRLWTSGKLPTTLQEANMGIHRQSDCIYLNDYKIKDTQICAGDVRRSSCQGDSGGPLLYKSENGLIVVGLVSFRFGSCRDNDGILTKVSKYVKWIHDTIN